ncbi:MAG: mycofactocin biosynthesis glycosyltransferase MftF, partial [Acidimicrobiia bacterium]
NSGWRSATADVVVFVDDDCSPTDGWLESLLAHFTDPRTVAVAPRIVTPSAADPLSRYEARRSPLDLGSRAAPVVAGTRVSYVPSAALAIRRSALAEVGGFDEGLRFGEDVDLVWRLASAGGRVRYEPAAVVEHPARSGLRDWLQQRFEYGTSAASLAKRHPGALSPLRVSPWSTLAWGAVAAGHPAIGAAVAATTTALLPRKLTMLQRPWPEALRLAGLGHLFAVRQISDALIRTWWPLALVAAAVSRRARRAVFAAVLIPPLIEWVQRRPRIDPLRWVALRLLDDLAYGAGVWTGCARELTVDPLVPRSPSLLAGE